MATYGEFSSLLQLGFGIGVGLSLFRAPVDIRTAQLARIMDGEILALRGVLSEFGRNKRLSLLTLRLEFLKTRNKLDGFLYPFMTLAIVGALLNLIALIKASVSATELASETIQWALIFVSVGYYLLLALGLEIMARYHLSSIGRDLEKIRITKAPI